ncbi:hypothetical protein BHM03_00061626 [Ensete ventricosum]|nr:hypothetical protein BHM03_00061626 [Ensete ventricosum]
MIILFSKGCPSPLPLPSLRRRRCHAQAASLHAIGVGSHPCGRRCCPRAAPRWLAVPPYTGAAPAGAAALAGSSPGRGRCLRSKAPPLKGALAVVGRPLAGGLGCNWLPLAAGLAVRGRPCMGAGHPSSSLLTLRKCSNNREGGEYEVMAKAATYQP